MPDTLEQRAKRFWVVALVVLLGGRYGPLGCTPHPAIKAPQTVATPSPYKLTFRSPQSFRFNDTGELVVRVRHANGAPVNGVTVMFEVEPAWQADVVLTPTQSQTQNGIARTYMRAEQIGVVGITARVGSLSKTRPIAISSPHSGGDSDAD